MNAWVIDNQGDNTHRVVAPFDLGFNINLSTYAFICRQILEVLKTLYQMEKNELAETIYKNTCSFFKWKL